MLKSQQTLYPAHLARWLDAGSKSVKSLGLTCGLAHVTERIHSTKVFANKFKNSFKIQEESLVGRIEWCGEAIGEAQKTARSHSPGFGIIELLLAELATVRVKYFASV